MPERERRVFVPRGQTVRLVLEGGPLVDIKNPSSNNPFSLEQKSPDSREAQREQLKAKYPSILFPFVHARLQQHGYELLKGGEEVSAEMMSLEGQAKLTEWMNNAKLAGISNQEIREETKGLLGQVLIGASRMGKPSPLINGIGTEISNLVDEVWGVKNRRRQASTPRKR